MGHLSILVPAGEGNNLSSIVGAYKIFSRANDYWTKRGYQKLFEIELVGLSLNEVNYYGDLFTVKPNRAIQTLKQIN